MRSALLNRRGILRFYEDRQSWPVEIAVDQRKGGASKPKRSKFADEQIVFIFSDIAIPIAVLERRPVS
jgi:hypothetical protein